MVLGVKLRPVNRLTKSMLLCCPEKQIELWYNLEQLSTGLTTTKNLTE
jgi:hypothetical protein